MDKPVKILLIFQSADTFPVFCQLATNHPNQVTLELKHIQFRTEPEGSLLPAKYLGSLSIFKYIQINM